jgi:hypothetical protein
MSLPRIRDRPTPDLIVFALTGLVIIILLLSMITLVIAQLWFPERNVSVLTDRIGQLTSSLIAAIVGYLAGRGVNGKGEH